MTYKAVELSPSGLTKKKKQSQLEMTLNEYEKDGWKLDQLTAKTFFGMTSSYLAIFIRTH
ncbi:DUF4177 domain-containing protein [Shouchella sp. JSM 1781072]|uniref:DUF4177 domain-containing protein n=1 Tax=Bacillaceae TaxID=186817 RepID=UPI000C07E705|nr:DUF4177 domain-containing protein [Bacillus sp. Marseille-P3800]